MLKNITESVDKTGLWTVNYCINVKFSEHDKYILLT